MGREFLGSLYGNSGKQTELLQHSTVWKQASDSCYMDAQSLVLLVGATDVDEENFKFIPIYYFVSLRISTRFFLHGFSFQTWTPGGSSICSWWSIRKFRTCLPPQVRSHWTSYEATQSWAIFSNITVKSEFKNLVLYSSQDAHINALVHWNLFITCSAGGRL